MNRILVLVLIFISSVFNVCVLANELQLKIVEAEYNIRDSASVSVDYRKDMEITNNLVDPLVKSALSIKKQYDGTEEASHKDLKTDVMINLKGCKSKAVIKLDGGLKEYSEFVDNIIINANDIYCFVKPSELSEDISDSGIELSIKDVNKVVSKYNGTSKINFIKCFLVCLFVFIGIYIILLNIFGVKRTKLKNQSYKKYIYTVSAAMVFFTIVSIFIILFVDWNQLAEKKQIALKNSSDACFEITNVGSSSASINGIYIGIPLFSDGLSTNLTAVFRKSDDDKNVDAIVGGKYIEVMDILQFPVNKSGNYYLKNNNISYDDIRNSDGGLYEAVSALAAKNIFAGKTNSIFAPDDFLTRADTVAILCKILDIQPITNSDAEYSDMDHDDWYYGYAVAAKEEGIFNGYGDNSFRGSNTITREEFSAVLGQIMVNKFGYKINNDTFILDTYIDKDSISPWAAGYISLIEEANIKIWSEEYLPKQPITRGEAAMLLFRVYCLEK